MLISTYIKSIKHDSKLKQIFSLKNLFSEDNIAINVFDIENKSTKYVFDIRTNSKLWKKEYENILLKLEVDLNAQVFNNFFSSNYNPQIYEQKGFQFVKNQNEELLIGRWLYPVLSLMAFIKMTLTAVYFYQQNKFQDLKDIFYLVILSLFYINLTWILSKTLGNYDLRRKTVMLRLLNDQLVMSGAEIDYHQKLDVLSVRSLETWDNVRRAVLEFFKFKQQSLEACYVCLFFYYLFVGIACLTAYGDIYIFLSKNSIYLDPIMIISNTMDFIILNIILFTRIYNGQKFNNTFSETDDQLDSIIGVVEDLLQIYDYYFNKSLDGEPIDEKLYFELAFRSDQKLNVSYLPLQSPKKPSSPNPFNVPSQSYIDQVIDLNKVESSNIDALQILAPKIKSNVSEVRSEYGSRPSHNTEKTERQQNDSFQSFDNPPDFYTIYDIFVAKIKYNAKFTIDEKIDFMGKPYELNFIKQLQIEMLQSAYKTLKRIKQQVEIDSKTFCYKFLGLIKVEYQETLITVVLAILTVMPQILTKLINIFKQNE
ncbi:transmembrane protein, putative (macronuclear) [Tetrahymena thermophila SB210]|uniref:Transmembrane protein, putative n=1 Tax=Tetrahymena thermophila (strain SB210) TaxID=312017 RepID=Q22VZ3_TETTS|nr:transmembrane protein, putative [Tetrahymena thermophila SB210]EAR89623.3 transmembrane protein, putative [Tetrahymena thermophila SB210]|eukprot:XP_001009869.3 transmembrane protein, putative [Tetrahymena thermophila SB210]